MTFKIRALCSASLVAVLLAGAPAFGQAAPSPEGEPKAARDENGAEDIVVTGVRESLRSAINEKRASDNISDVIKAEDIGELPDASVADSLQRITGVQIVRDIGASRENVSGQAVNIRGLPSLTILNGRTALPGFASRDFDFRVLASESFGELIISKTPTADRIEGGLGGTIELNTRNPLDFNEPIYSVIAQGVYLDYADTINPRLSGFATGKFLDGRAGFLLSGSYQKLKTRQDQFVARGGWVVENGYTGSGFDFDKNGVADAILPSDLRLGYGGDEQERIGVDGSLFFEPTDRLTLRIDGSYARFNRAFINGVFRSANNGAANAVPGSLFIDPNGTLLAGTFRNQVVQADGRLEARVVDTWSYGFNAKWESGRLDVNFDVAQSGGSYDGRALTNRYQLFTPQTVAFDFRNRKVPDIVVGSGPDLTDRSLFRVDLTFNEINRTRNEEFSTRLDLGYDLDGFVDRLSAGVRYARAKVLDRVFFQNRQENNRNNPVVFDPVTGQRLSAANPALDPLFQGGFPVGSLFKGVDGNFPRQWLFTRYPGGSVNSSGIYGEIYGLERAGQTEDLASLVDITEETLAGYARADFTADLGSVPMRGNVGVRVIGTDIKSTGLRTQQDGTSALGDEGNDYVDVLPSATAIFDLRQDLLLRVAAGRVMRRPDIPNLRANLSVDRSALEARGGNVKLKPFRADQIDASLEWYFSEDGLLSGAVFYKKAKNFITITTQRGVNLGLTGLDGGTSFTVTRPINSGSADIKGFEVNYQQAFTFLPGALSNLGAIANYTYTDADTTNGRPFPNLSKHVYNIVGYYDDGTFDVRLAYNWRSNYSSIGDGSNGVFFIGIDEFVDDPGQLDLSTSLRITNNFQIQAEVLNLTAEDFLRYSGIPSRVRDYRVSGRTFTLGLQAKF